jgi:transposase
VRTTGPDVSVNIAICEAVTRPTMRFVPVKQLEQQDLQALHRVRERLIKARTALVNEIRGLLGEYGMVLPQGMSKFRTAVVHALEDPQAQLTPLSTEMFRHLYDEFLALEKRVAYYETITKWGLCGFLLLVSIPLHPPGTSD